MHTKKILLFLVLLLPINCLALTKAPIDITKMNIQSIEEALKENIITSEQLVKIYLERIEEYKSYNAIISINENAIEEAKKLDEERSNGKVRSLLHGVPIVVKDNIDVVGLPTTAGAKALKDNYPKEDAYVIKKLKESGAIILAKTNMSEFAFSGSSSKSSYGTVKNAYNLEYSPYGSSGGSAVSVAASFAAASLGTDTNSSVRTPASANYLVGYRPTYGNISHSGLLPYDPERDTIGVLTKTVNDSIILTNIIMGYDEKDKKSTNKEYKNYQVTKKSLEGITLGIPNEFLYGKEKNYSANRNKPTYSEIVDMMERAIKNLEKKGAKIVYLDNYYTYTQQNWSSSSYSGFLFCDSFNKYIKNTTGKIRSFESLASVSGRITNLSGYLSSCNTTKGMSEKNEYKKTYANYITKIMEENNLDAIFYPATKNKLLKLKESDYINLTSHAAASISFPAITMPLGFDKDNLPYGIEFMAKKNNDELLYNIVSLYEQDYIEITPPKIAPNLYEISTEDKELLKLYKYNITNDRYKEWITKVKEYYKNYNEEDNTYASSLLTEYHDIKSLPETIKYYSKNIFKTILKIVGYIILTLIVLIIFLLIRKFIRRKIRRMKRKKGVVNGKIRNSRR